MGVSPHRTMIIFVMSRVHYSDAVTILNYTCFSFWCSVCLSVYLNKDDRSDIHFTSSVPTSVCDYVKYTSDLIN